MRKQSKLQESRGPLGHIRPCPIIADPQGCFAGKPIEQYETPVQTDKL